MRISLAAAGLALVVAAPLSPAALAQAPAAPAPTTAFASAADVAATIAKAKEGHKEAANTLEHLMQLGPYAGNIEYRKIASGGAVHEKTGQLIVVLDGGATIMTGGRLLNQKQLGDGVFNGTGIEGGVARHITKGDMVIVPQDTPQGFTEVDPGGLVMMTMRLPGAVDGKQPG